LMGKLFVVQRKMHEDARERSKADEGGNNTAVNRKPSPAHASEGRGDVEMSRLSIGEATDRLVQIGEAHENGMECDEEDERSQFLPNSMSSSRRGMMSRVSGTIAMIIRHGCGRQVLVLVILSTACWIVISFFVLPVMDAKDRARLKVPESLSEVQEMYGMLGEYKTKHYWAILIGFAMAYLIKMVLALPGSPLFNLLGGALFGVPVGFIVCMACTSIGTALCYVFFQTFGGPVVRWLLLEQLVRLDEAVRHHRRRLFYYLTVIRIFPITPNFFINLAAPLIRLPLVPHVASATIGLAPITFLTVQAGMTLSSLESLKDAVDRRILITLGGLAIFASIPLLFRRSVERSLESLSDTEPVVVPEVLRADSSI